MSARDTFVERAKKATELSREQVHAYLGANDYWYQQVRTTPSRYKALQESVVELPATLRKLGEDGLDVASAVEPYKPANLRQTVQDRLEEARQRRSDLAERGEKIAKDWHNAAAAKDIDALVSTVRTADGAGELARSVRTWLENYPPAAPKRAASKPSKPASKPSATKPAASAATRKPAARKTTTSTTARKSTARKSTAAK